MRVKRTLSFAVGIYSIAIGRHCSYAHHYLTAALPPPPHRLTVHSSASDSLVRSGYRGTLFSDAPSAAIKVIKKTAEFIAAALKSIFPTVQPGVFHLRILFGSRGRDNIASEWSTRILEIFLLYETNEMGIIILFSILFSIVIYRLLCVKLGTRTLYIVNE